MKLKIKVISAGTIAIDLDTYGLSENLSTEEIIREIIKVERANIIQNTNLVFDMFCDKQIVDIEVSFRGKKGSTKIDLLTTIENEL